MESHINLGNALALDGGPVMVGLQQCVMLLLTLELGLWAERWARLRGCAAREAQGALPLPVVAAIIGVGIPWMMFAMQPLRW
jgi:hypothetical protein